MKPLGYDWRMGVGILSGVGAKELMVSTLGVLYNAPEDADGNTSDSSLSAAIRESGTTPAAALSYLVFALLYFPCMATIAAIRSEADDGNMPSSQRPTPLPLPTSWLS